MEGSSVATVSKTGYVLNQVFRRETSVQFVQALSASKFPDGEVFAVGGTARGVVGTVEIRSAWDGELKHHLSLGLGPSPLVDSPDDFSKDARNITGIRALAFSPWERSLAVLVDSSYSDKSGVYNAEGIRQFSFEHDPKIIFDRWGNALYPKKVTYSWDGNLIAIAGQRYGGPAVEGADARRVDPVGRGGQGFVELYNAGDGRLIASKVVPRPVDGIGFSGDRALVTSSRSGYDGEIILLNGPRRILSRMESITVNYLNGIAVSSIGTIAAATLYGLVWRENGEADFSKADGRFKFANVAAFSPNGRNLALGDENFHLLDVETKRRIGHYDFGPYNRPTAIDFPNDNQVIVGTSTGAVYGFEINPEAARA